MKKLISLLTILSFSVSFAQKDLFVNFPKSELKMNVSEFQKAGGAFNMGALRKTVQVLTDDNITLSNFKKTGMSFVNKKGTLEWIKSDGNFNEKSVVKMKIGLGKGDLSNQNYFDCFYIGKTPVLLTREREGKEIVKLRINVLNKTTYAVDRSEEVYSVDFSKKAFPVLFGFGIKIDMGNFGYVKSPNNKFFTLYSLEEDKLLYKIYDENAEEVRDGEHSFEEIPEGKVSGVDFKLSDEGELIILQSSSQEVILSRLGNKEFSTSYDLELEGKEFASEINMELKDSKIFITGLVETFEPFGKKGRLKRKNIGIFNFNVDSKTGKTLNSINNVRITDKTIKENLTKYDKKRIAKGKSNAKDFLNQFSLSDVVIADNGEVFVMIEYFDYYVTTSYSSNGGTTTTPHYVGGNVIAFKFGAENELEWEKTIVKYSNDTSPIYRSFKSLYDNDDNVLHLIFNDHGAKYPGNHAKYKGLVGGTLNRVFTDYNLNANGEGERKFLMKAIEGRKMYKLKTFRFAIDRSKYYDGNPNKLVVPILGKKMGYIQIGL